MGSTLKKHQKTRKVRLDVAALVRQGCGVGLPACGPFDLPAELRLKQVGTGPLGASWVVIITLLMCNHEAPSSVSGV